MSHAGVERVSAQSQLPCPAQPGHQWPDTTCVGFSAYHLDQGSNGLLVLSHDFTEQPETSSGLSWLAAQIVPPQLAEASSIPPNRSHDVLLFSRHSDCFQAPVRSRCSVLNVADLLSGYFIFLLDLN